MPAKKRPPAVKAILKQILMFGFYILLRTYEIDSSSKEYLIFEGLLIYDKRRDARIM